MNNFASSADIYTMRLGLIEYFLLVAGLLVRDISAGQFCQGDPDDAISMHIPPYIVGSCLKFETLNLISDAVSKVWKAAKVQPRSHPKPLRAPGTVTLVSIDPATQPLPTMGNDMDEGPIDPDLSAAGVTIAGPARIGPSQPAVSHKSPPLSSQRRPEPNKSPTTLLAQSSPKSSVQQSQPRPGPKQVSLSATTTLPNVKPKARQPPRKKRAPTPAPIAAATLVDTQSAATSEQPIAGSEAPASSSGDLPNSEGTAMLPSTKAEARQPPRKKKKAEAAAPVASAEPMATQSAATAQQSTASSEAAASTSARPPNSRSSERLQARPRRRWTPQYTLISEDGPGDAPQVAKGSSSKKRPNVSTDDGEGKVTKKVKRGGKNTAKSR